MPQKAHLYLVATGSYTGDAPALAGEIWQTGVRLSFRLSADQDPIGTLPDDEWDVVSANIQRTETAWTIDGNWTIEGGVADFDPGDYLNDQAGPAFRDWMKTLNVFSQSAQLDALKLYPISAPNGTVIPAPPYAQGSPVVLNYTGTKPKGANSGLGDPTASIVHSLRTSQTGRRGRGRMYTPPHATSAIAQGIVSGTAQAAHAAAGKALLEGLAVTTTEPVGSSVRPVVIGAPYTNYAVITHVRVGNVVDHQLRRRNALTEAYVTSAVDYG